MAAAVAALFLITFREDLKALFLRIAKIRFPGGAEVSTSQSERQEKEIAIGPKPTPIAVESLANLPSQFTLQQQEQIRELINAEQATSRLWEYRFLNYFLVPHTQRVLDWMAQFPQQIAYSFYDTQWLPIIPSANERGAIASALQAHHLVQTDGQFISITPKGHQYIQWRGPPKEAS